MRHFHAIALLILASTSPVLAQAPADPVIRLLGLTDVSVHPKKHHHYGSELHARLPGGAWVELDLNGSGEVEEIDSDSGGFPVSAVQALLPEAVKANPSFPKDAVLYKLELDHKIEMEGRLADGRKFDAEFSPDGHVIEFDTD